MNEIDGLTPLQARRRACSDLWWLNTRILDYSFLSESLHKPWCKWLDEPYEEQYRIFLAPRDHCKTTIGTIGGSIQDILKYPGITIMLGHYKKLLGEKFLFAIKQHLIRNRKLKAIAPDICFDDPENESPVWTRDQIMVKREGSDKEAYQVPTIYVVGKDASATSLHFDKITIDDPVVEENEGSAFLLQETYEWIQNMEGLLSSTGMRKVDLRGTRWRHNDTFGLMLGNEELRPQIRLFSQAILQNKAGEPDYAEGEPIWKENSKYGDKEWIRKLEVRSGSFRFWANYMNSPVPKGSAVFNMEDVDIRPMDAVGEGQNMYAKLPETHPDGRRINYHFYTAVDPNTQESNALDAAVVMTCALDDRGHLWLVKMDRGHPNQSVLIEWILLHNRLFQPKYVHIESIAYQTTLSYWLKQQAVDRGIYIAINEIKKRAASKYARIVTLQGITEGRRLHGPNWKQFQPLWDEMSLYTEASKKDDCLDCLADIAAYSRAPEPAEGPRVEKVRSPVTIDSILGRMAAQRDRIVERDDRFARKGVPVPRRLFR